MVLIFVEEVIQSSVITSSVTATRTEWWWEREGGGSLRETTYTVCIFHIYTFKVFGRCYPGSVRSEADMFT